MPPKIENPANVLLTPMVERVIQNIFVRYQKVIICKEFGRGLSGGRVFEVRPIRENGAPELPTVVKLAPVSLIQQEWLAYQQHVYNRLPYSSQLTNEPVFMQDVGWGGLRYAMSGGGTFEVVSLRDYYRQGETSAEKLNATLNYLFRIMGNVWRYSVVCEDFNVRSSYDQVLPVNLLVQPLPSTSEHPLHTITPTAFLEKGVGLGDRVRLAGFAVHKVNYDTQSLTLRSPHMLPNAPNFFMRYKLPTVEELAARSAQQVVDVLDGEVLETRISRLQREVRLAFADAFDPMAQLVPVADGLFANPLLALPWLLAQTRTVQIATVHGDFNLENILVEPETGAVSVIDFADAREDHVLHDFLRLETEVLTRLIPELVQRHHVPLAPVLAYVLWHLHGATFQSMTTTPSFPHPDWQKPWEMLKTTRRAARDYFSSTSDSGEYYQGLLLYLLGALKFKNLNDLPEAPLPKQAAFYSATLTYHLLTLPTPITQEPPPALLALLTQWSNVGTSPRAVYPVTPIVLLLPEQAERRIAALPTTGLAPLGALPAASRMPYSRNALFVGRTDNLKQIAQTFSTTMLVGNHPVPMLVITGLGGLGKTQLATEFVHRYGRFFAGGVYWLSLADERAVPTEVATCGRAMRLRPDYDQLPLEEQNRLVAEAWQSSLPRLLIFDNCESPELLEKWRPKQGGCRVLVTSRRDDWPATSAVQQLFLEVLTRAESMALLREHRPEAEEHLLDALAQAVGDLPLALHLAGSYLGRYRHNINVDEYLGQLRQATLLEHRSLQSGGASPTDHDQSISHTIALSFHQLDRQDALDQVALGVLARVACLALGEPIPLSLLALTFAQKPDERAELPVLTVALNRLAELGLGRLEMEEQGQADRPRALRLHRLVVAYLEDAIADEIERVRPALEQAFCEEAEQLNATGYPAALLAWQVHLRALVNAAYYSGRQDERTAQLYHVIAEHFRQIGDYARAHLCLQDTVTIRRKLLGDNHELTARSLSDLGAIFWTQQDWTNARACYESALAVQEEKLGEHADTAMTLNHLGTLHQYQADAVGARPYHERALAIRRKIFGEEHTLIAQSLCNLAYLEYLTHNYANARAFLEQALTVQRKAQGDEHPYTANLLNNLGELLREQGDFLNAQKVFAEVLLIQQKVFASEHPENARVLHNLGWVWQAQGDLQQASAYYEAALKIRLNVLGETHTDTAITLNDWGELRQAQGDLAGARQCYERALTVFNARLGSGHFRTRRSEDNLVSLEQSVRQ